MKIGNVSLAAAVIGAIWGAVWMVLVGITLMLVSGVVALPQVGIALIIGAFTAVAYTLVSEGQRTLRTRFLFLAAIVVALMAATLMRPFGISLSEAAIYQIAALVMFGFLTFRSIERCLAGYQWGSVKRYQFEVLVVRLMKGLAFVFFTVLVVLPFYVMVMTSLKSQQEILANPLDFSIDIGQGLSSLFRSYIELFTQFDFGIFLVNSALVSVVTVAVTLLFAVPGAYAVARLRFSGQAFLSRSILLIYMVPAIILVIPLYAVFSQLGLRNTLTGLMIVYPATTIPVALYMLQGYFRGLPSELEEAGLMDGLSRTGVILKITLPLALPALASVSLYVFMIAWNEFLFAFMFLDDVDIFTLSRGVVSLNSSEVPRQHLMAGAVIATIPILILFLWFERFLVAGLTAGSVKG